MRAARPLLFPCLLSALAGSTAFGQAIRVAPVPRLDLDVALNQVAAANNGWGGCVFRVGAGNRRVLYDGVTGRATRGGALMERNATFEIASTSKTFTAATVLLLMEEGALALDDAIGNYLPPSITTGLLVIGGTDYGPQLTIRQLLAHTSGLPDYWYDPPYVAPDTNAFLWDYNIDPNRFWTPQEILAYVPQLSPIFSPGAGWHYSDTGYALAGLVIEQVTGKQLHDVFEERLFQPLGLDNTWLKWRQPPVGGAQESHRYEWHWDMTIQQHQSADWAGGGLASSTRDLETFIRALADGALFSSTSTMNQMTNWTATGEAGVKYGLGLYRVNLFDGQGYLWGHDGYGNSWMYYYPRFDVTLVGALNQTENDWWPLVKEAANQLN